MKFSTPVDDNGSIYVSGDGYAFLGSYIIEEVVRDLIPRGLARAKKMFLTGTRFAQNAWIYFIRCNVKK